MSFQYPRWNPCTPSLHHILPFGKYCHQLFTISFHESLRFQFLAGASKNVLSRRSSAFWARVGRVTGTKQLFCHGLSMSPASAVVWGWRQTCAKCRMARKNRRHISFAFIFAFVVGKKPKDIYWHTNYSKKQCITLLAMHFQHYAQQLV